MRQPTGTICDPVQPACPICAVLSTSWYFHTLCAADYYLVEHVRHELLNALSADLLDRLEELEDVYKRNSDLPKGVKNALSAHPHAQKTFRSAFNNAKASGKYSEEELFQIAWAAVKNRYHKKKGTWREKKGWKPAS